MKKASVTMVVTINMNVPDNMDKEHTEGFAYWILQPFLEGFTDEINGCSITDSNITIDEELTQCGNQYGVLTLERAKELEDEIFANIEDYHYRVERAMVKMDRMRCSLAHADSELYNEMLDALEEFKEEHELSEDDKNGGFDPEDIIF